MARDFVKGQRTVRTADGREFAVIRGRRWTRIPEYMTNGQLTARFFVDEATGEVRQADSWKKPKRWPMGGDAAAFVLGLLALAEVPAGTERKRGEFDGYMTHLAGGWEVAARGELLGRGIAKEQDARALLMEFAGAGLACWRVGADGEAVQIA
jgi:hypothetical protein